MRFLIPLVLLLLFGLAVWLLAPWERTVLEDPPFLADAEPPPAAEAEEDTGPALRSEQAARVGRERAKGPRWPVVPTTAIGTGSLEVVPLDEAGEPIPVGEVEVELERKGAGLWSPKLPLRDVETRTWRFDGVPWGQVEVHVYGEHVRHTVAEAFVPKDDVDQVRVATMAGGAIAIDATLRDGSRPRNVVLSLISPRARRAIPVHARSKGGAGTAPRTLKAHVGAEGRLLAIPPGTYRLEATSDEGSQEVFEVTVTAGQTTPVQIVFAY